METKKQKLANQKFTLKSRYGDEAVNIAECSWSRFKGPVYEKVWFKSEFEMACWSAHRGLVKEPNIIQQQYLSQHDQEVRMYHGT